ncbi:hypothetical protein LCGC14_3101530, partial [marine sediment metagenome]
MLSPDTSVYRTPAGVVGYTHLVGTTVTFLLPLWPREAVQCILATTVGVEALIILSLILILPFLYLMVTARTAYVGVFFNHSFTSPSLTACFLSFPFCRQNNEHL